MAELLVPHLLNDAGANTVRIGVKEFKCMGASPPHDHPHVYLNMGEQTQLICPYCSTVYVCDPALGPRESDPPGCVVDDEHAGVHDHHPSHGREAAV